MKRIFSVLMAVVLALALIPVNCGATNTDEAFAAAQALNAFGLFSGTGTDAQGNPIYELERQPTRQEAITMLVKLVGGAEESSKGGWETPFTDVDDWAKNWVGYAYAKGLTAGTSATTFGANDKTTAAQYLTFVLKALGYDANSDFSWDNAWPLAEQVGISKGEYNGQTAFTRGDMAIISYRALSAVMKGTFTPLSEVVFGEKQSGAGDFAVHFIDVGQADAALVVCDGETMLIDGGNREDSQLIYTYLKNENITHLDYIVATHAHEDHVGGLAGALNYATVGTALCSVGYYDSAAFNDFVAYLEKQGKQIVVPEAGDTFELGSAQVQVLGPVRESDDPNNMSLVLRVEYGETSFLFTGDAEREEERDILDAGFELESTVLKVGHHGSENSTTYPFLREVMPEYAVISVGEGNSYGHPTEEALSRLRDAGVSILRTDVNGLICCTSDGEDVYFVIERDSLPEIKPGNNTVEGLQTIIKTSCDDYNERADKILDGTLSFAIVSATEVALSYDVSDLIYTDTEYLVDEVMEQILDCVVGDINESKLPEEVNVEVTANYNVSEDSSWDEYYPEVEPSGGMVWIPNTGSKYHSYAGCSNMKKPSQVPKAQAIAWGYTACKKCW